MTLSRNQKKRILIKNYEKLTKKEKKNINDLTRQISKPTVAPNNLPTLLTSAIERTSEIKGKKYNQVNYYFSYAFFLILLTINFCVETWNYFIQTLR